MLFQEIKLTKKLMSKNAIFLFVNAFFALLFLSFLDYYPDKLIS